MLKVHNTNWYYYRYCNQKNFGAGSVEWDKLYSDCIGLYRISILTRYCCNIIVVLTAACLAGQKQFKSQVKLLEVYNFLYSKDFHTTDVRRVYISVLAVYNTYHVPRVHQSDSKMNLPLVFLFFSLFSYLYEECVCF